MKSFDGVRAVDGVSVRFDPGCVSALIGPNGAGKTTLFHLIAGALSPDQGAILFGNEEIHGTPAWRLARMGVGRLFQDVRVFSAMTALENVLVAFQNQRGENPLFALTRFAEVRRDERELAAKAVEALARVGLASASQRLASDFSYGEQKLIAIARLLVAGSTIVLLDEPAAGVDPEMLGVVKRIVRGLAEEGRTVVVIEHNIAVVAEIADEVWVLADGRIIASGPPALVLADRRVQASYLGTVSPASHR